MFPVGTASEQCRWTTTDCPPARWAATSDNPDNRWTNIDLSACPGGWSRTATGEGTCGNMTGICSVPINNLIVGADSAGGNSATAAAAASAE